ncbi:alpha/beta fold hydrolase [Citricoccus nitrophenolicus]|uniref:alpha/beta fold hydrolase n=1 Tax=Citricoccus nitrophenolicus TaxID=863575 RepID=UPI0031EBA351
MANFVLIHGAFHGGWCWTEISSRLKDSGHTVVAPDLPGAGDDQTPLSDVTLASATDRVIETLRSLDGPAVLVGHSMGGVVITQAAARVPDLVSRLVYLTAFRPTHGESLLDLTNLPEGAGDGVQSNITVDGEPLIATFDLTQASTVFYNGVPQDTAQQAIERLDLQPLAVFATPVDVDGVELPPQEYVVCTQDRAIMPALQKLMAERSPAQVHELEAGHSPFYSHPDQVLEILLAAV